jgi:hypothetical protein
MGVLMRFASFMKEIGGGGGAEGGTCPAINSVCLSVNVICYVKAQRTTPCGLY